MRRWLEALLVTKLVVFCVTVGGVLPAYAGDKVPPVTPEELKMTGEPQAPGAAAIILFRQVDRDDSNVATGHEDNFVRIKILTEEGRKYADVEIPFSKGGGSEVINVKARTIHPDGSVVSFEGKPFDKNIVKAKGVKYLAKTFTLPDVQIGSVIEYSYTLDFAEYTIFDSHWILSEELFTRRAKFSMKPYSDPYSNLGVRWTWQGLPPGSAQPKDSPDHVIRLEVANVPAFHAEDYMPPENELKSRVDFTYSDDTEKDPVQFWKKQGKKFNDSVEKFIGKQKAMEEAVAQMVAPGDSSEEKLRKIYARVQQLHNTSFDVQKTEEQKKREKQQKEASNVEELWKKGAGPGDNLTLLFLALVRAAKFEAYAVRASDRANYFFHPEVMDQSKLDTYVVVVKLNGKDIYCDPGSAFASFGMLPWAETGVKGLQLDRNGGAWIQTAMPESSASREERHASLALSSTGDLEGKLTITYTGLEARQRRLAERNEDDTARKKFLEDGVKEFIPVVSEAELTNKPDWSGSSPNFVAEFNLKIPGWASSAGRRALLAVGIFGAGEKHVFDHTERVHPIYFEYPFVDQDDVTITLPPGWQASSLPPAEDQDGKAVGYTLKVENDKQTLHLTRKLRIDLMFLEPKYYPALRDFFQMVRKGDEQQIVLQPGAARSSN